MFLFKIIAACYLNLSTSCGSMSGNKLTLFIYLRQSRFLDIYTCINKNGALTTLSRQNCNDTVCTTCTDGVDCAADPSKGTDGVEIECADPSAYPALNGGDKVT